MGLVDHAERELRRAGLFDKGSDYEGKLAENVMALMNVYARQGHSGQSAMLTLDLFGLLAKFQTLSPITSNPDEWNDVSEQNGGPLWQSNRNPEVFSRDGGQSWYRVGEWRPGG